MKLRWDAPEQTKKTFDKVLLNPGNYRATIAKAAMEQDQYERDHTYNPDGTALKLWLDCDHGKGSERIFTAIGIHKPHIINQLLRACGLPTLKKGDEFNPAPLLGKTPMVKLVQYTSKGTRKTSNIVDSYLPASPSATAANQTMPGMDESDIPF